MNLLRRALLHYRGPGNLGLLARAVVGSAGVRLVGVGLAFLVGVQIARGLGVEGNGLYGIAMALMTLAAIPVDLGLTQVMTREAARARTPDEFAILRSLMTYAMRVAFVGTLLAAFLWGVCALLIPHWLPPTMVATLGWAVVLLPFAVWGNLASAALRGLHRVVEGQLVELLIRPAIVAILFFVVAHFVIADRLTPANVMAMNAVAAMAGLGYASFRLRPLLADVAHPATTTRQRREWRQSGLSLALGEGLRVLSANLGLLLIGTVTSVHAAGLYRVAVSLFAAAALPVTLINIACAPMLVKLYREKQLRDIGRLNAAIVVGLVGFCGVAVTLFAVWGESLIGRLFGADFKESNSMLLILLASELIQSFFGYPWLVLSMLGQEQAVSRFTFYAMLLNGLLCVVFLRFLEGEGVALAFGISQICLRLMCWRRARSTLSIETSFLALRRSRDDAPTPVS